MNRGPVVRLGRLLCPGTVFAAWLRAEPVLGCAACYGQSDSPMAAGMNWGIFSLLGFIVAVLGGVAGFFIFLSRRSRTVPALAQEDDAAEQSFEPAAERIDFPSRNGLKRPALVERRKECSRIKHEPAGVSGSGRLQR